MSLVVIAESQYTVKHIIVWLGDNHSASWCGGGAKREEWFPSRIHPERQLVWENIQEIRSGRTIAPAVVKLLVLVDHLPIVSVLAWPGPIGT
jgi:hypothetical protein